MLSCLLVVLCQNRIRIEPISSLLKHGDSQRRTEQKLYHSIDIGRYSLATREGRWDAGKLSHGPGPEEARKFLVYSIHDNAIGTKHIGGDPDQNYDPGLTLALDGPDDIR